MPLKSNRKVALSEDLKKRGKWQPICALPLDTEAPLVVYLEGVPFALLLHR